MLWIDKLKIMDKKKITPFSAKTALEITSQNRMSIDECFETIEGNCKNGQSTALFFKEIDDSVVKELMDLGYMFGKEKDSMGMSATKISWA